MKRVTNWLIVSLGVIITIVTCVCGDVMCMLAGICLCALLYASYKEFPQAWKDFTTTNLRIMHNLGL